jgi:hypothetical protein
MLLDFDLLEFDKLGAAILQTQATSALVNLTVLTLAHLDGHEGGARDGLVGLGAASVARVRAQLQQGLDFGRSDDHALDIDQFTDAARFDLPNRDAFHVGSFK